MNVALPSCLTVDQFQAWAVRQEEGKYELIDGAVIKWAPQNWGRTKARMQAWFLLREAVALAALPFFVAPSGPMVRVSDRTAFAPDALVALLPEPALDSLEIPNAIIIVEGLSPSTARLDATTKLRGYFQVPRIQHYLIVDPEDRTVTHHKRGTGTALETHIVGEEFLALDPPGIEIRIGDLFAPVT